jgi:molybdopterin-containing oxidoreductase family membrane subunit
MPRAHYREIEAGPGFLILVILFGLALAGELASSWYMRHYGHVVSGMGHQIVWGIPHVFAFFLIVSASGALNVASMASVFGRVAYKPLARLSGLLAIALLAGGLSILVLDLGRPERLTVAMTNFNFKSIFSWNINFYVGFLAIVAVYLFLQMARGLDRYVGIAGLVAFLWRLSLTTATGSVLGFLAARQAYDAAIMAPLFIAMSLALGQAIFLLVIMAVCAGTGRPLDAGLLHRMARLLAIFLAATLYFAVVQHVTNLYSPKRLEVERFLLVDGGIYTALLWVGYVVIGSLLPIGLGLCPAAQRSRTMILAAAVLAVIGGLCHLYVLIVGGQAFPLLLFPGMDVASSFGDGMIASYRPSLPEFVLVAGGVSLSALLTMFGMRLLPFVPMSFTDDAAGAPAHAVTGGGAAGR